MIFISLIVFALPIVWLQIYYPHQSYSFNNFIKDNYWGFTVFRLLLIIMFFMVWPVCIRRFAKNYVWTDEKTQFWLTQRYRITAWLIIFELLVCENFLSFIIVDRI
jgi:hypothetical protein